MNLAATAKAYEDVVDSVTAFHKGLEDDKGLQGHLSFFRAWYYIPELDAVGPSKFVGYKGMTASEYMGRYNKGLDGRETEPVLGKWFDLLDGDSVKGQYVARKVEQLLQRYGKRPSRVFRCSAPRNWRLGTNAVLSPAKEDSPKLQGPEERPMAEIFWRAFLTLYPKDQAVLAQRILSYTKE